VRSLRNGQITIPSEFRKKLDLNAESVLEVALIGNELRIRPVKVTALQSGSPWFRELYKMFAPVRKEAARTSVEKINHDIDRAVAAVRRNRASRRS
jgi:AbrB family looped-hinge helix DNA binding protein